MVPLPPSPPPRLQEPGDKFESEEHIKDNQCDIIKVLVAHGASLSAADEAGLSAKDLAHDQDFFEAVDLLEELEGEGDCVCMKHRKMDSLFFRAVIIDKETRKRERKQRLRG